MPRRLSLIAAVSMAASAALLGAVAPAAVAGSSVPDLPLSRLAPVPAPLPAPSEEGASEGGASETAGTSETAAAGAFTITVADTGFAGTDGTFKLTCGPVGGTHPRARAACERLAELRRAGQDPFAPVTPGALCTMQHGGDATARITGIWHGHRVHAFFDRKNGCEIARWRTLEPVLPRTRP
ncbi:SSI family serine proteinase inhibitor [Streptomyces sp. NPDC002018]|uniref:SSI family serine proteinase inhibitor n=1 Tax=Streptomyces sp. NPDC002018 TaxID=3364629 RepID=UPI0036BF15C1